MKKMNNDNFFSAERKGQYADKDIFFFMLLYGGYSEKGLCLIQLRESLKVKCGIISMGDAEMRVLDITADDVMLFKGLLISWLKAEPSFFEKNDPDLDQDRFLLFLILEALFFIPKEILSNEEYRVLLEFSRNKWLEIKSKTKAIFPKGFDSEQPDYDGSVLLEDRFEYELLNIDAR